MFYLERDGDYFKHLTLEQLTFIPRVAGPPDRRRRFLQIIVVAVDTYGKKKFSLASLIALDEMDRWRRARYWQLNPDASVYRSFP